MATRESPVAAAPLAPPLPSASPRPTAPLRLDWLDPIKAFALVAILLNHLVEEFGHGPWFTNPGGDWPASLTTRLHTFFPAGPSAPWNVVRFLGWLGDNGPGVFIFASGVGLTLSALRLASDARSGADFRSTFYRRRLLRLYPLYIAMHVVILGLAVIVPGVTLTFSSPATLLSLLGLRITPGLFFYIAPAWWFVWLILQLYAVYPWLLRALDRWGPARFLTAAVAVTVVSRAVAIMAPFGLRYDLLTGMFFGCRLAEFATGMVVAQWLAAGRPVPSTGRVAGAGTLLYVAGLAASFTLAGALVSNWLVAIGLTALFYVAWRAFPLKAIAALGVVSYSVFLLHQPPLKWTALLRDHPAEHALAALLVLAASIPAAAWIERTTDRLRTALPGHLVRLAAPLSWIGGTGIVLALLAIEPQIPAEGHWHRALAFAIALVAGALLWLEALDDTAPRGRMLARRIGLLAGAIGLFAMPEGSGYIAAIVGIVAALAVTATGSWLRGAIATIVVLLGAELVASRVAPREVGGWGERPALEIHPTRAFGLIPNKVTHLRYNDYDYVIRADSFGLASPSIPVARPTPTTLRVLTVGDAFTMPEGIPYEQSYPALLQTALARCLAPRPVQVINGGVTGYGPLEELAQVRELSQQFTPDIVVHEFFVNDWQDITIGTDARRRGIGLVGHGGLHGLLRDRSHLVANLRRWYESAVAAITGTPSPDQRWKLMLDYFKRGDNALYDSANVQRMATFFADMQTAIRANHGTLITMYVPAGVAVLPRQDILYLPRSGIPLSDPTDYDLQRPYTPLAHITDALGVTLVDLTGPLKAHQPQPVYYPNAWHWTPEGHRTAAEAILSTMRERGLIPASCTP